MRFCRLGRLDDVYSSFRTVLRLIYISTLL